LVFLWGDTMKIDLEKLRLGNRESLEFHFDNAGRNEYLNNLGGKYQENLKVDVQVEKPGRFYLTRGQVKTVLELQCSRCLERFCYPINMGFHLNLVEAHMQEEFTQDEDVIFFDCDEVEIQPFIEQLVFLEIPFAPICKEECKGLCPECGTNQNLSLCQCRPENNDPRWDKLKDLKFGKEVT
jgi:uncharacterized protein